MFKLWNRLRSIRPEFAPVYNWLGRAYMLNNDLPNARSCYAKSLKLNQPLHDEDLNYGRVLRWSGALEDAITLLRPMAQSKPDRLDIARELASALTSNREYQEALPIWNRLLAKEPSNLLFRAKATVALLHSGQPAEAVEIARAILQQEPGQLDALGVLADYAQYFSPNPEQALPLLLQLANQTEQPSRQRQLALRFVALYGRLHGQTPEQYPLDQSGRVLARLIEKDPQDADSRLALGETLLILRHYAAAREQFHWVLEHQNPNNTRALRNLFEIALVEGKPSEAGVYLQHLFAFNPRDPYRHYYNARFHLSQNRFVKALEAVDQLEAAGAQGAIAVLLYHGLSSSDHGEVMPASRLTEHIRALKAAGFSFFGANELPRHLLDASRKAGNVRNLPLEREVCITFDDARRDSMRYGTPVGVAEKVPFSMHVPVGYANANHPFICTWDQLRDYQKAGCWLFGGHSWDAHERVPIDAQQHLGFALPNHLWLPVEGRLETNEEYDRRLQHEYTDCQQTIVRELGRGSECTFFAYPFGDLGQLTRSNDKQAPRKNLQHVGQSYACGFIQTSFGHAVATDHPMLYQRIEPDRLDDGATVVRRLLENHPVTLARTLRAAIYAQQDKRYGVRDMLALLARDGYPADSLQKLHATLERQLGRNIPLPKAEEAPTPGNSEPLPPVQPPATDEPLPALPSVPMQTSLADLLAPAAALLPAPAPQPGGYTPAPAPNYFPTRPPVAPGLMEEEPKPNPVPPPVLTPKTEDNVPAPVPVFLPPPHWRPDSPAMREETPPPPTPRPGNTTIKKEDFTPAPPPKYFPTRPPVAPGLREDESTPKPVPATSVTPKTDTNIPAPVFWQPQPWRPLAPALREDVAPPPAPRPANATPKKEDPVPVFLPTQLQRPNAPGLREETPVPSPAPHPTAVPMPKTDDYTPAAAPQFFTSRPSAAPGLDDGPPSHFILRHAPKPSHSATNASVSNAAPPRAISPSGRNNKLLNLRDPL
jgi:tetratricopeptide (TPR) repeat protein